MSGLVSGSDRGIRGGYWDNEPQNARVATRGSSSPGNRYYDLGFRLIRRVS